MALPELSDADWEQVFSCAERLAGRPRSEAIAWLDEAPLRAPLREAVLAQLELGSMPEDPDFGRAGERVGAHIELRTPLRHGGSAAVYLGLYEREGRFQPVAVKLLRAPERSATRLELKEAWLREQRLLRELAATGRVAEFVEAGEHTGGDGAAYLYLCTEYKHGLDLRRFCSEHALGFEAKLRLWLEVCDAVSEVHAHGIVHGDLKPENVQVELDRGSPRVWLLDLGLSAVRGHAWHAPGELLGTPSYMAPEQLCADRGPVSEATDVYALACIAFELLEGRPWVDARGARSAEEILARRARAEPLILGDAAPTACREPCEVALRAATALEPRRRPVQVAVLRGAVERALADARTPATAAPGTTAVYGAPRSVSQVFVGRSAELSELEAQLGGARSSSAAVAIEGLAGSGKTELALQLVQRLARKGAFPGGIFWLNAEDRDLTRVWGTELATRWGIPQAPLEQRAALLLRELGRVPERLLVVLDSVSGWGADTSPGPLPEGPGVSLLATTRTRGLGGARFSHLHLDLLAPPHDRELVGRICGERELPELSRLLEHLGGHTLALELAAAFLYAYPGETPQSYLEALQGSDEEVEAEVREQVACERTVAQSFRTLWEHLPELGREAWRIAARFESEPASRDLAAACGLDRRGLRALEQVHLIQSDGSGCWRMHRLSRAFGQRAGSDAERRDADRAFLAGCLARVRTIDRPDVGIDAYLCDRVHLDAALVRAPAIWTEDFEDLAGFRAVVGAARSALGELESARRLLEPALDAYRSELEALSRAREPRRWATLQHQLAFVLRTLGQSASDAAVLEQAELAYGAALQVRSREDDATAWAATQEGLSLVLRTRGELESSVAHLERAREALCGALEARPRASQALFWARTQLYLGGVLFRLGEHEPGTLRLREAVAAFRAALEEYSRERTPVHWATAQENLANALCALGKREPGTDRLEEAVHACRAALEVSTRERAPLAWAQAQHNLGAMLSALAQRRRSPGVLAEAVRAYRAALEVHTRERMPIAWAMTQGNLASVLHQRGLCETGTASLEEAANVCRAALEACPREHAPLLWAALQHNLGAVLLGLAERQPDCEHLEACVHALRAALEERTRERMPLARALTLSHLGRALRALGEQGDPHRAGERFEAAVEAHRGALDAYAFEHLPQESAEAQSELAQALHALAERHPGEEWRAAAITAYREAHRRWSSLGREDRCREIERASALDLAPGAV